CPVCLGHHPHHVHKCNNLTLWNGSPAFTRHASKGCLISGKGVTLCSDWQKPNSCSIPHKSTKHDCSGCGKNDHGTQRC
ncbi:hypothetical protein BS17DRAFT_648517, partial [Gyrodon lividus]